MSVCLSKPLARALMMCVLGATPALAASEAADTTAVQEDAQGDLCAEIPEPVVTLNYGSRYTADSDSRSDIDEDGDAEVTAALKPVDDFIRKLTRLSNEVINIDEGDQDKQALAACVISALQEWANAGALGNLETVNAKISVGSRIAGVALPYWQVKSHVTPSAQTAEIDAWLTQAVARQLVFWEQDASAGTKSGNLRMWAALGYAAVGLATDTPAFLGEAEAAMEYVLCTANEDGSIPQEMRRGKYALHYQLHAIAPMVTIAALLNDHDGRYVMALCNGALAKAVNYAAQDIAQNGALSLAHSGEVQSYYDGTETFEDHEFAWFDAYLTLDQLPSLFQYRVNDMRPLNNSKLGGNQSLMWGVQGDE